MTSCLSRIRRRRRTSDTPAPRSPDPTRPHVVMRDGLPIIHEGPPGFPGRFETTEDEDR